ncbi:ABC transporter ATP-binding protein [Oceanobacillus chungangensis]|uniref:ABC transporter ATP-binding protein n=1 Tax=Oceanobacillus chungangensis TaxID=1229152 RepID=A0A3D8PJ97_9BACI|nr:ABC transporter ATP-binding protein [Oceanobacillus chungangensis]RDW16170.1 ABC transporter ATP-binding protein [Oceanobacillus chungangensis]
MKAISTWDLTKRYGNKTVVNNLNLEIEKGSIFGFLGKNGAGKSTFINMITGLTRPTSGSFEILGEEGNSLKKVRHRIGVLPDYSTFYETYTALDHLKYYSKILRLSLTTQELKDILKKVELEDAINLKTKNFSFGMKKKLGLAQALINKPDLLFLDEPTSGVDANSILNIHSLIREVSAQGTTIFLTSHNLDEVEKLCDDIAIMNKGIIQIKGNMQQLRKQYQDNISVYIKHESISETKQSKLRNDMGLFVKNVNIAADHSEFHIEDESAIPKINNYLVSENISVYRLEVEEPSLEEIFLNLGEKKHSA